MSSHQSGNVYIRHSLSETRMIDNMAITQADSQSHPEVDFIKQMTDREPRCKNISDAEAWKWGMTSVHSLMQELRWLHLIVSAARDHCSAVCPEGRGSWLDKSWLVSPAQLSNEKFKKNTVIYPFSFLLVSWLTGNLFLISVLRFCWLLVFQRRSWTVPQWESV